MQAQIKDEVGSYEDERLENWKTGRLGDNGAEAKTTTIAQNYEETVAVFLT